MKNLNLFAKCLLSGLCAILYCVPKANAQGANQMAVHFINVGQADAALLEFPCGAVLIDAGAQDDATEANLLQYLNQFFTRRADLHNTLDLVILSHDHIDHDYALRAVAQAFHITHYIDNGHTSGTGEANQGWMETDAKQSNIPYESISFEQVTATGSQTGITDNIIEPLHCSTVTPEIHVLSGRFQSPTDLSRTDFANENNHSLVVKVQFGKASFLFTGDLQSGAEAKVLAYYAGTAALQADVWKVSHHGSTNGTTDAWVKAVAPHYAVISCGQWNYGMQPNGTAAKFTTYAYGHPNIQALQILQQDIIDTRPQPVTEHVGVKGTTNTTTKPVFTTYTITHSIYDTAWDGTITITASSDGQYAVVTNQ